MREDGDELLTATQVAKMWHVSQRTVQRYISSGKLPAVRLPGGHYRVPSTVARAILNGGSVNPGKLLGERHDMLQRVVDGAQRRVDDEAMSKGRGDS